mmetsp:Transcript_21070/g.58486  ORF Transcript_21070/g.58486 Transcript_21070/m.58486 type:complete len:92 (-) Transcript_21070:3-278(-)
MGPADGFPDWQGQTASSATRLLLFLQHCRPREQIHATPDPEALPGPGPSAARAVSVLCQATMNSEAGGVPSEMILLQRCSKVSQSWLPRGS